MRYLLCDEGLRDKKRSVPGGAKFRWACANGMLFLVLSRIKGVPLGLKAMALDGLTKILEQPITVWRRTS